ncbi:MAG: tryptophan synthase subunit alpha [Dehalococcoidia bacterium]|nr:tryptophan synthase subunit alpha [Dehalococcoidia bacterium]
MSRIPSVFADRRRKALVAYVTMGYPSMEETLKVVPRLAQAGCDIIELGIPFSDPMADGTTIQEASHAALQAGVTPAACLEAAAKLSATTRAPLVFMTYFNPVLSYGVERFCQASARVGVDGLLVTDLPPEEGVELGEAARRESLDLVYLLAPTSTTARIKLVAEKSTGFIYLVSVTGVTGARAELPQYLEKFVSNVRKETNKPLCVGFGISSGALAKRAAGMADGVVVGSRVVQLMGEGKIERLEAFIKELRDALDSIA